MNVLIACEESQRVCMAFREKGANAYSCDIQEQSGGHPEWHTKQNVLPLLHPPCLFETGDGELHLIKKWDLIIAHPPCTYLTVAANKYYNISRYGDKAAKRLAERERAINFFMEFVNAECEHIAIENPVGVISTRYRKPDCVIQPWMFGHPVRKTTCLWLKNLPSLAPSNVVTPDPADSHGFTIGWDLRYATDENGKILPWGDPRTAIARSKTFPGIAKAMADQWYSLIINKGDSI